MSQELATLNLPDNLKALFAAAMAETGEDKDDLSTGGQSFPVLSTRGKQFRIRRGEEETDLGDKQRVIIVGRYPHERRKTAKSFYLTAYDPKAPPRGPDCMSFDGINPIGGYVLDDETDEYVQRAPQAPSCEGCEHNVWGTGTNGKGRRCRDEYRLSVVRIEDAEQGNWTPLLFLVTPGAIKSYTTFRDLLKAQGVPLAAASVELSFDSKASVPVVVFSGVQVVSPALMAQALSAGQQDAAREMLGLPLVEGAQDMSKPQTIEGEVVAVPDEPVRHPNGGEQPDELAGAEAAPKQPPSTPPEAPKQDGPTDIASIHRRPRRDEAELTHALG